MRLAELENVKRFLDTLPTYELNDVYVNGVKLHNYKAICYKGTNKVVAIVSNRYKLIQHSTVFNIAIEKITQQFKQENIKGWVEHTKTKAYLFLTFKDVEIEQDSKYSCGLVITNSVNTQLSVWLNLMTYRFLCSNLLTQHGNVLAIQNKHLGTSDFWNRFKERLSTVLNEFETLLKQEFTFYEQLRTFTLTKKETNDYILMNLDLSKKAYFIVLKQINDVDTLFNVYQAITNYYTQTKSMNIANKIKHLKDTRKTIEQYVKSVLEKG
jgi:hypothetical protein